MLCLQSLGSVCSQKSYVLCPINLFFCIIEKIESTYSLLKKGNQEKDSNGLQSSMGTMYKVLRFCNDPLAQKIWIFLLVHSPKEEK